MIKGYDKFDANMNTYYSNHIYQIVQEANNFDFIITEINVSELILCQMIKLPGEAYLIIAIHGTIQSTVASCYYTISIQVDLLLFYIYGNEKG